MPNRNCGDASDRARHRDGVEQQSVEGRRELLRPKTPSATRSTVASAPIEIFELPLPKLVVSAFARELELDLPGPTRP